MESTARIPALAKLIAAGLLVIFGGIYFLAGLTHVHPGEVTILIKNIGDNKGMQKNVLDIGTHWIEPFTYDTVTYDVRQHQEAEIADLPGATADGQPVTIDFSLQMGLDPAHVPALHAGVGKTYYDSVVYPAIRSIMRDKVASKTSAEIYTAEGRHAIELAVNDSMKDRFGEYGILAEVNLREVTFNNKQYVATLEQKAAAAQAVEIETRRAQAAAQTAVAVANEAEGKKQARIKAAEAQREESRLAGEGERLKQEETAKGILATATAEARGTQLRREALSGAGGAELVSIEWAHNLGPNVKVYGFPTGAPGTNSIMDLNGLMMGAFSGAKVK